MGKLSGYKTYITAAVGVILAWAAFLIGEPTAGQEVLTLQETIMATFGAVLAATLRHGVQKDKVEIVVWPESDEQEDA